MDKSRRKPIAVLKENVSKHAEILSGLNSGLKKKPKQY